MHARRVVVTGTLYRRGGVRAEAIISTVLVSAATFLSWVCTSLYHACIGDEQHATSLHYCRRPVVYIYILQLYPSDKSQHDF